MTRGCVAALIVRALPSARGGPQEEGQEVSPSPSLLRSSPLPGAELHSPEDEQESRSGEGRGVDTGDSEMEKDAVGEEEGNSPHSSATAHSVQLVVSFW